MLTPFLQLLGWALAHVPEPLLHGFSVVTGDLLYLLAPRRRRVTLSNLDHAFPERSRAWHRKIAREGSRLLVETALLSLATPFLSEARVRRMSGNDASTDALERSATQPPRPLIMATLHLALWETQTWMPLFSPKGTPEWAVIFRPLDNPGLDAFVKRTRERFGMKLLSRKAGFADALRILRNQGWVGVLSDQNAGMQGALTTLFGRVCSTTELPGVLATKLGADVWMIYPRRRGFWRVTFHADKIVHDGTTEGVTVEINRWLERALSTDEAVCAAWLWAHDRWRNQDVPARRLRLEAKRNFLAADLRLRGLPALPRRTRLWIRMPNWLGDVVMALPLLRAIRESRPDAEITLVAKPAFLPLLKMWDVADRLHALPPKGPGYFLHFRRLRAAYIDTWILFTNSTRGDIEAWLTGCRQRFGIVRPAKRRPLLSHSYARPAGFHEPEHHQLELWEHFLKHFGLIAAPVTTPLPRNAPPTDEIGLIAGSENNPEKRWPVEKWRELIAQFPRSRFVLFGTANDQSITNAIAQGFEAQAENLAGRTTLPEYCERLRRCRVLVSNDTGGMHLANGLGIPVIALFGPTNPVRTRPVFTSPVAILQPQGCPPTGGAALADLPVARVADQLRATLA